MVMENMYWICESVDQMSSDLMCTKLVQQQTKGYCGKESKYLYLYKVLSRYIECM